MEFAEIVRIVESKREELKGSEACISVVDFGAGSPQSLRTKEEMEQGVVSSLKLCELAKIGIKQEKAQEIFKIFCILHPKVILELGTCLGFSSSYMALFAPESRIYTLEGAVEIAKVARENHQHLGIRTIQVIEGRFACVLPSLLEQIAPLDFVFIDGHHDRDATLEYFTRILPSVRKGGVMLFDDITWSLGMREAWREISCVYADAYEVGCDAWKMGVVWL